MLPARKLGGTCDHRFTAAPRLNPPRERDNASPNEHRVTLLESMRPLARSCDCPDFVRSSLGLCKHLLVVLDAVHRADRQTESAGSLRPRSTKAPRATLTWAPLRHCCRCSVRSTARQGCASRSPRGADRTCRWRSEGASRRPRGSGPREAKSFTPRCSAISARVPRCSSASTRRSSSEARGSRRRPPRAASSTRSASVPPGELAVPHMRRARRGSSVRSNASSIRTSARALHVCWSRVAFSSPTTWGSESRKS